MAVKLSKRELNNLIKELKVLEVDWSAIYLFGSTAKGYATKHSDRDFCVVVPDRVKNYEDIAIKLNGTLGMKGFNFDIILTTSSQFEKNKISPILHEIRTTGIKVA